MVIFKSVIVTIRSTDSEFIRRYCVILVILVLFLLTSLLNNFSRRFNNFVTKVNSLHQFVNPFMAEGGCESGSCHQTVDFPPELEMMFPEDQISEFANSFKDVTILLDGNKLHIFATDADSAAMVARSLEECLNEMYVQWLCSYQDEDEVTECDNPNPDPEQHTCLLLDLANIAMTDLSDEDIEKNFGWMKAKFLYKRDGSAVKDGLIYAVFDDSDQCKSTKEKLEWSEFTVCPPDMVNIDNTVDLTDSPFSSPPRKKGKGKVAKIRKSPQVSFSIVDQDRKKRPVAIDASNLCRYGDGNYYDCRRLETALEYFKNLGHQVFAFVPQMYVDCLNPEKFNPPILHQDILKKYVKEGYVVYVPHKRNKNGKVVAPYDDVVIAKFAHQRGGVIVSNDLMRDVANNYPMYADTIYNRYVFSYFFPPRFPPNTISIGGCDLFLPVITFKLSVKMTIFCTLLHDIFLMVCVMLFLCNHCQCCCYYTTIKCFNFLLLFFSCYINLNI